MDEYIYFHRSLIIDELNQFVTLSIQAHRLGEMRVGGCIDSRAIVALMAQQTFFSLHFYSEFRNSGNQHSCSILLCYIR